ncbi:MAG: MBL fold hydrolase [Deltaproteobacteria bacterium HGW-Deltaproteobacteria-20]|jgi:glyoxylase-like metal-dependent hydrolase (beta-lactamase superfamily II)|nr:MAG: MBL fold hydrolase [Deltaproteobacteria bacterium HGW-Deltaproteobacteria-20]
MFRIDSLPGNTQRLDGGAMYGNCPRPVWEKWSLPDERHRIPLACRALLIRDGARTVLLETGIGTFFEPKLQDRFGVVEREHVLLQSLGAINVSPEDVDVVVLSHLHFDHAGGMLTPWQQDREPELVFPNASFIVGKKAWERATHPHPRDRASFIPRLHELLEASGRLELVDGDVCETLPSDTYEFCYSDGHTPGLTMTRVRTPRGMMTFVGDLIPGVPWVHLPITMGYDRYPELLIEEKKSLLDRVMAEDGWLFFTHDPHVSACRVRMSDKGKYEATDKLAIVSWADEA